MGIGGSLQAEIEMLHRELKAMSIKKRQLEQDNDDLSRRERLLLLLNLYFTFLPHQFLYPLSTTIHLVLHGRACDAPGRRRRQQQIWERG